MITRIREKLLLTPKDFKPSDSKFQVIGAFNPGAARFGDEIVLLVRIAEAPVEKRDGFLGSPRAIIDENGRVKYTVDWLEIEKGGDHRKPLVGTDLCRLAFISHLALVRLDADGYNVKSIEQPRELCPVNSWEEFGLEDPRITEIDGEYYITYVSVSREMGVCTSLISTRDFVSFTRHGVIFPWENKDVVLLPEKVNGKYLAFHRPVGRIKLRHLAMQTAWSPDLIHWGEHGLFLGCGEQGSWDCDRIGAGAPPFRTSQGWLQIYHGVKKQHDSDTIGMYYAGATLSSFKNPGEFLRKTREPIIEPVTDYEKFGFVNNVVFVTGTVRDRNDDDNIHIYCGAADTRVAVITLSIREILSSM